MNTFSLLSLFSPAVTSETSQSLFLQGKEAFNRGQYRQSLVWFEQALAPIAPGTVLGGEIQLWQVNAYHGLDQGDAAVALCRQLTSHPSYSIRQQAQRLLYILEAPRLSRPKEWMTEIPDLTGSQDIPPPRVTHQRPPKSPEKGDPPIPDPPPSGDDDPQFLTFGLIVLPLLLILFWFSFT